MRLHDTIRKYDSYPPESFQYSLRFFAQHPNERASEQRCRIGTIGYTLYPILPDSTLLAIIIMYDIIERGTGLK